MNTVTTRMAMFPARKGAWRSARTFIDTFCREAALAQEVALKCSLVLEELFLNTVTHGHGGDCDAPVWIRLVSSDDRVTVIYEDRAPPFNPFAPGRREELEAIAPTRTEGGLGVILAHGFASATRYTYLFGRNRIQLTLA